MASTQTETSRAAELERLRRELLRRIIANETRRQAATGSSAK